jgi:PAS domain S-box-containing protein
MCLFFSTRGKSRIKYGGLGPGLAAAVLGIISIEFFIIQPSFSFAPAAAALFGAFSLVAIVINRLQSVNRRKQQDLLTQREWFRVTLSSIGDAVIATDPAGRVTFMNPLAQELTGWNDSDARGNRLEDVFNIVNENTRQRVENLSLRDSFVPSWPTMSNDGRSHLLEQ